MGQHTEIQWCDSTVNPTTGCDGCELWKFIPALGRHGGSCYSAPLHEGRLARSLPGLYAADFTEVRLAPGRMAKAAAWPDLAGKVRPGKPWIDPATPRLIFVGDMGDVMSRGVPPEYLKAEVFDVAASKAGRRHIWMILTKQGRQLWYFADWLRGQGVEWPTNVWAGVSVTSQKTARRAEWLCRAAIATRFVSYEPALEWVDLTPYLGHFDDSGELRPGVDLVIVGGESDQGKHEARPFDIRWAWQTVVDCHKFGAVAFVKQLGSNPYDSAGPGLGYCAANILDPLSDSHGGDWSEWPSWLRVRQFPAPAAIGGAPC